MQAVGNLLDVQVGRQEQGLALGDDMGFDAGEGRLTGLLLDNDRQVFGGDAELRCVEGDLALGLIVAFEQEHELLEQILPKYFIVLFCLAINRKNMPILYRLVPISGRWGIYLCRRI